MILGVVVIKGICRGGLTNEWKPRLIMNDGIKKQLFFTKEARGFSTVVEIRELITTHHNKFGCFRLLAQTHSPLFSKRKQVFQQNIINKRTHPNNNIIKKEYCTIWHLPQQHCQHRLR
jgi:hypothetical protein